MCEDVDSGENRGWPRPSIGKGKREGGLSANVLAKTKNECFFFVECIFNLKVLIKE